MKKIMIIAGEASGDLHGASLIENMKAIEPELKFFGIGGDNMINAGMNPDYHIKDMSFLGFFEVVKHIPFIKKVQKQLLKKINNENIERIVLIDYPGFNLNFAKKLHKLKKEIYYYISPQLWAWGKGRIKKIKKMISKMIVVFPFEKEFYKNEGIDVAYVGHPLVERVKNYHFMNREELIDKFGLNSEKEILLLMPGSRKQEIKSHFSLMIKAAEKIASDFNLQIVVLIPPFMDAALFDEFHLSVSHKIINENNYDLIHQAKFGIIKSGTSTIEAGLLGLPMIVVYSTGRITYSIGKALIKVRNIAMINIIAGKEIVPELIQNDLNIDNIYEKSREILSDNQKLNTIKNELAIAAKKLGDTGASKRAAELILDQLK